MPPGPLEALQRRFVASVLGAVDPALVAGVTGGGRLAPEAALAVYRNGYPARLTEALGETYERVWRVLGDDDFFSVCRDFIATSRSVSWNLSDYGRAYPEYLESREDLAHAPFLGDLARLEWAFKEVFHALQHDGLTPEELASRSAPRARFSFGAATALLSLKHRVHGIWTRDLNDDSPLDISVWTGEESIFLYKKDNRVFSRLLSVPEAAALSALKASVPLDEALNGAAGLDADAVSVLFRDLAEARVVTEAA